jgi:hypothetical protein
MTLEHGAENITNNWRIECFNYLGSMITSDARGTREIKYRIATAKAEFNKKTLFTSKLELNPSKKLVKCYIWNTALYGAETWTLRKVDRKYLARFKMWCWKRTERIIWTDRVRNEVLHTIKEQSNILHIIKRMLIGHTSHRNCLLKHAIEGKLQGRIEVTGRRGGRSKQLQDDLQEARGYWKLKEEALDRTLWRTCFGRGYGPVVRQTTECMNMAQRRWQTYRRSSGQKMPNPLPNPKVYCCIHSNSLHDLP